MCHWVTSFLEGGGVKTNPGCVRRCVYCTGVFFTGPSYSAAAMLEGPEGNCELEYYCETLQPCQILQYNAPSCVKYYSKIRTSQLWLTRDQATVIFTSQDIGCTCIFCAVFVRHLPQLSCSGMRDFPETIHPSSL